MSEETKELLEQTKQAVAEHLNPLRERLEQEKNERDEFRAETMAAFDKAAEEVLDRDAKYHQRIDALEARFQKIGLDTREDETTTEKAIHAAAFESWARKGEFPSDLDEGVKATLQVRDESAAGILVPTDQRNEIIRGVVEIDPMRTLARIVPTSRESVTWPKRTGRPTVSWRGEGQALTESTGAAIGQERIPTHMANGYIDLSIEVIQDEAFNLVGIINEWMGESFGEELAEKYVSGTGTLQPEGFLTNSSVELVPTITNDVLAADDVRGLKFSLKESYAMRATWLANRLIFKQVFLFVDQNDQYLWQPAFRDGMVGTLDGMPYREAPSMASAVADGAKVMALGDWNRGYIIVDRLGITAQRDPYTRMQPAGEIRFTYIMRTGGQVVLPEAIKVLQVQ